MDEKSYEDSQIIIQSRSVIVFFFASQRYTRAPPEGVLPSKRLLGMCRWMGSHFHNWTDYNGVTFLVELLEWGRKVAGFLG